MPEGTKGWSPDDSDLTATIIELVPNNEELQAHAMTLDATGCGDFSVVHKESKKGKDSVKAGTVIVEVSCTVTFADPMGAAKLEAYMLSAARSEMTVTYTPQAVQDELPGTRVEMGADDKQMPLATPEQREAVEGIEDGTIAEAVEEARRKRGRPRKDVQ